MCFILEKREICAKCDDIISTMVQEDNCRRRAWRARGYRRPPPTATPWPRAGGCPRTYLEVEDTLVDQCAQCWRETLVITLDLEAPPGRQLAGRDGPPMSFSQAQLEWEERQRRRALERGREREEEEERRQWRGQDNGAAAGVLAAAGVWLWRVWTWA